MLTPLIRAVPVAHDLPMQFSAAFGEATPRSSPDARPRRAPLDVVDLFSGMTVAPISPESLVFAKRDGETLSLDVYRAHLSPDAGGTGAPGILVIHGGSWQSGDRTELSTLNRYLADRGYVVAAIDYRLGPRFAFPAALEDVRDAIRSLKANASLFGLDSSRLVLLGRSAGGQLALLAAYTFGDPAIRGVVAFYAPADLDYAYEHPANPAVINSRAILESYLDGSPDRVPERYRAASPIQFVGPLTPPTLLIHGGRDELVTPLQSERLAARLVEARRPSFFLRLPWATHGCDANVAGPCGQITTYAIEHFLAAVIW
ncbi:MAG: alpha/beta hydrolase [Nitrospirae bacterium]|nr:alpha/beta hydrolase [Nitrospirota bacterium]